MIERRIGNKVMTWHSRKALYALGVFLLIVVGGCGIGTASNGETVKTVTNDNKGKIEPALRIELVQLGEKGQLGTEIVIIIKANSAITDINKSVLETTGFRISSVIADIATGTVVARNVADIASLDFVRVIQIAKKQQLR